MSDDRTTLTEVAATADLNQAANTVLLTLRPMRPIRVHRFGVVADAAAGLLAAMDLKLRTIPVLTGTAADIPGTDLVGAVVARGSGIVKTLGTRFVDVLPGNEIVVAVATDAGATSTGDVFIEYEPLSFQVANIANVVETA